MTKPVLLEFKDWGELNKTTQGGLIRKDFMGDFNSFVNYLDRKLKIIVCVSVTCEYLLHINKCVWMNIFMHVNFILEDIIMFYFMKSTKYIIIS